MDDSIDFIVTARKWRPLKFRDVIGQSHITTTLLNSIKSNRIAHSYLFSGPRGVGKTTTARIFARAVNCENPDDFEPCNECSSCLQILENRSLDVIEIDGASNNSVDDVRKLRENAKFPPVTSKYKLYIIDEVHMLSTSAFNALLKTLEEPPPHLLFIFATTEPHKVPATILSRCQRFDFRRMEVDAIVEQLRKIAEWDGVQIDNQSLHTLAVKADGSMRDAQSSYDQAVAFCGRNIRYEDLASALHLIDNSFYFRISKAVREHNFNEVFAISNELFFKGYDINECLGGLLEHFRNLLTLKVAGRNFLVNVSSDFVPFYEEEAKYFSEIDLVRIMSIISATEQQIRFASQPRLKFELALLQLASLDASVEIKQILDLIQDAEGKSSIVRTSLTESNTKVNEPSLPYTSPKSIVADVPLSQGNRDKFFNPIKDDSVGTEEKKKYTTIREGWEDFVLSYGTTRNNLHLLRQISNKNVEFFDDEIIIALESDFLYEGLSKSKQALVDALQEFYGKRVGVKLILQSEQSSQSSFVTKEVVSTSPRSVNIKKDYTNLSPVERVIIETFNAKPLQQDDY